MVRTNFGVMAGSGCYERLGETGYEEASEAHWPLLDCFESVLLVAELSALGWIVVVIGVHSIAPADAFCCESNAARSAASPSARRRSRSVTTACKPSSGRSSRILSTRTSASASQ